MYLKVLVPLFVALTNSHPFLGFGSNNDWVLVEPKPGPNPPGEWKSFQTVPPGKQADFTLQNDQATYVWTDSGVNYKITADTKPGPTGINGNSIIGPYTFTNGTQTEVATFLEMTNDVELFFGDPNADAKRKAHMLSNIDNLLKTCEDVTNKLVCPQNRDDLVPVHDELRRLLNIGEISFIIIDSFLGAAVGAAGTAAVQAWNHQNITDQAVLISIENAAVVTGFVTFGQNMRAYLTSQAGQGPGGSIVGLTWIGMAHRVAINIRAMTRGQRPPLPILPITSQQQATVSQTADILSDPSNPCTSVEAAQEAARAVATASETAPAIEAIGMTNLDNAQAQLSTGTRATLY
ncbi:uncharacterized protein KY384_006732 [Bacidia gigantensis]|uniref:uncharacterized protein n=1 Tax=Bacidia gigantensis TaxID=2732470 RepID=UPI001D05468B|nr:uncharacterized protein KY384_006732 [Bacidia gigantensis]KAG8528560.1 hypothetical protein KY384_006732 [Bacidia gigantensis]